MRKDTQYPGVSRDTQPQVNPIPSEETGPGRQHRPKGLLGSLGAGGVGRESAGLVAPAVQAWGVTRKQAKWSMECLTEAAQLIRGSERETRHEPIKMPAAVSSPI